MGNSNAAISVKNVSKTFQGMKSIKALNDVSFDVDKGSIVGLLGRNGAGKTTLIRIMATLLLPSSGKVNIDGFDILRHQQSIRRLIGYAGQDTERSLYYRLNPRENAKYFGWLRGLSANTSIDRLVEFTSQIGMEDRLDRRFIALSGGEKQVFVVLRALLHYPPIAFLDEPSKSLDVITARKIRKLLQDYVADHNATLVITSHNLKELEDLCDYLVLIHEGRKLFDGSPRQLKQIVKAKEVVEILGSLPSQTISEFQTLGEVLVSSNYLRIVTSNPYRTIKQAVQILETHKLEAKVRMSDISLEDAFANIVQEDE